MAEEVEFVSDKDIPHLKKRGVRLADATPVSGSTLFGFHTPKRRGALAEAGKEVVWAGLPLKAVSSHDLCGRVFHKSNFFLGVEHESDTDDNDSDSEAGTVDETPTRVSKKSTKGNSDQKEDAQEEFFEQQSSKCITSDHTLSKLNMPRMDQQKLLLCLNQVSSSHPKERFELYHKLQGLFDKWMFHLRNGFNILLYGLGSKRVLLDQFRSSKLSSNIQVIVNGFFPSLTIKNVLNIITEEVLMYDGAFKSVTDQCDYIRQNLCSDKYSEEIFLIIHNIDGSMLRSKKTQTILSLLAEVDTLHVIASIDHINAPLIWNHTQLSRFNWSWFDVTSFEPYREETSYENSLLVQHTGALALSSLVHVFRSLTPNARGIFILIAQHQLDEKDNSSYIGLSFNSCYSKCREQFLVNSDSTLKAQLIEFRDHKLITSKKGADGVEYLYIPVDSATLKQFIEDQQNNNT
ncbi:Origin recognition complex subunit 2 [Stylophora pistillata]|uniref:Origin recognition complex subunit 2 n=1 Tax=Stylophora pistillata TaxID=50429 RepID=A0A2B4S2K0_STYPI|nr:Origin recognition complex subunit 2 [Stylophora pistillata]